MMHQQQFYCNNIKDYNEISYLTSNINTNSILNNLNVNRIYTSEIDIKSGSNIVNLFPNATNIYIGETLTTLTTIKSYLEVTELGTFQKAIECNDALSFTGINNTGSLNTTSAASYIEFLGGSFYIRTNGNICFSINNATYEGSIDNN